MTMINHSHSSKRAKVVRFTLKKALGYCKKIARLAYHGIIFIPLWINRRVLSLLDHYSRIIHLVSLQFSYSEKLQTLCSSVEYLPPDTDEDYSKHPACLIIALSTCTSEPRVLRECELMRSCGVMPIVVSMPATAVEPNHNTLFYRVPIYMMLTKNYPNLKRLYSLLFSLLKSTRLAILVFLSENLFFDLLLTVESLRWLSDEYDIRLIIAHDYYAYPAGLVARNLFSAPLCFDIHEHALSQYRTKHFIKNIYPYLLKFHGLFLKNADLLGVVSPGILKALESDFSFIQGKTFLLRNLPLMSIQSKSFSGDLPSSLNNQSSKYKLLYSGLITSGRGLTKLLQSVPLLSANFELTLLGPIASDAGNFVQTIKDLQNSGYYVNLLPPVPFDELISFCSYFDVGYLVQDLVGPQKQYSLANKFFEYIHAGLCLCVDSSIEMSRIVTQHDLGIIIPSPHSAESIASALNALSFSEIQHYKNNSKLASPHYEFRADASPLVHIVQK